MHTIWAITGMNVPRRYVVGSSLSFISLAFGWLSIDLLAYCIGVHIQSGGWRA